MTTDQILVFSVIAAALVMFVWNRWRYDIVALCALLFLSLSGIIPADKVFSGFGHPAVITVAAVLLISRGLLNAGVVDAISRQLARISHRPTAQVATLTGLVALLSGFMNNTGALALFMPVGVWLARQDGRSPSFLLMPLAFGSLIGGCLTLIGTPPNIILSTYRQQAVGAPYAMFDFLPVGVAVTVAGVAFITLVGWRMIPKREQRGGQQDLFEINSYLTELRVPVGSKFAGHSLRGLYEAVGDEVEFTVTAMFRERGFRRMPATRTMLHDLDILQVEVDTEGIKTLMDLTGLELAPAAEGKERSDFESSALKLVEAIVPASSLLVGRNANRLELRENNNVNILAVARRGERMRERIDKIRFMPGDILLMQMHEESLQGDLNDLGLLPLAARGLRIGQPRRVLLAAGMFAASIVLIALDVLSAQVGMTLCALAMVLSGMVKLGEVYESIEMPVIVLLACMLPIGAAMDSRGGSKLIADALLGLSRSTSPALVLALLMGTVMLLSTVLNHAASTVLAAPVAIKLAQGLEASPDPFLMAVCIGASCTFLTPLAHQSNTLVMGPGGYKFGDYWRMGLPLSIISMACAVPVILLVWPL